jgi:hypothetical protein
LYYSVILFFIGACQKEINFDLSDHQAKLVVNGHLYNDSLISIDLSISGQITQSVVQPYVNGVVELFDKDTNQLLTLNNDGNGRYFSSIYKTQANTIYFIKIKTNERIYWIREETPDTVFSEIKDSSRFFFQGNEAYFQLKLELNDKSILKNFYEIKVKRFYKEWNGIDSINKQEWVDINTQEFVLTESPTSRYSKKQLLFSDRFFNGQKINLNLGMFGLFNTPQQRTTHLQVYVSSLSLNAFNYYTSINEHLFFQNDPFTQPSQIIGNVPDAYGAITGRYLNVETIVFK